MPLMPCHAFRGRTACSAAAKQQAHLGWAEIAIGGGTQVDDIVSCGHVWHSASHLQRHHNSETFEMLFFSVKTPGPRGTYKTQCRCKARRGADRAVCEHERYERGP